jgi:ribosome-associated translation inhibitor RaiA
MSDRFRKVYLPLTQDNHNLIMAIKEAAEHLERQLLRVQGREMSLAITNLEQSIMWASKAVALHNEHEASK